MSDRLRAWRNLVALLALSVGTLLWPIHASSFGPDRLLVEASGWAIKAVAGYVLLIVGISLLAIASRGTPRLAARLTAVVMTFAPAGLQRLVLAAMAGSTVIAVAAQPVSASAATPVPPPPPNTVLTVSLNWPGVTASRAPVLAPPVSRAPTAPALTMPTAPAPHQPRHHRPPAKVHRVSAAPTHSRATHPGTVTVEAGECLWTIAAERVGGSGSEVARAVQELYDANRAVIGPDPNVITPGERLTLPVDWSRS